jgi:hypothetical protein
VLVEGIRSTPAHERKHHPLDQAHTPTASWTGAVVYCICGWQGCQQRLEVDAAVWEAEAMRRARPVGPGTATHLLPAPPPDWRRGPYPRGTLVPASVLALYDLAEAFGVDLEATMARTFGESWRESWHSMSAVMDALEAEIRRRLAPPAAGHAAPAGGSTD